MRAVVQRTSRSSVIVDDVVVGKSDQGLTVLLGVCHDDSLSDVEYMIEKIVNLRIFPDSAGKMNLSLTDINGELMVISQFTLYGDCRKGRRPSFDTAAKPELARELYVQFITLCRTRGLTVSHGQFQADMVVSLENYGPVTVLLDSKRQF